MGSRHEIELLVNGERRTGTVPARMSLADFLRDILGLTGTHLGCEHGVCGACTVLLDGDPVRSCIVLAAQADGQAVTTIEGAGTPDGELGTRTVVETAALEAGQRTQILGGSAAALLAGRA